MDDGTRRREFLAYFSGLGLASTLFPGALWAKMQPAGTATLDGIREAAKLAGLDFTASEQQAMLEGVNKNLARYREIRGNSLPNEVPLPLYFDPRVPGESSGGSTTFRASAPPQVDRPANLEDAAFLPVTHLAELVRTKQVSAVALTEMYLARLEKYNPLLNCVVTLTKDLAMSQARRADSEIAAGRYLGPLHGIPWGAKDIIFARGYPTTWGAEPFRDQTLDVNAAVVERLSESGAVLVAKLTTGELAFGDQWFGGRTNSPWNPEDGSSGSSAGSGAATAAGLVGFAIGTDTGGSILAPSVRCGIVGMRPTFGRVSRFGVMAAGFSLDRIGPMCRTAEDCALVLRAIAGPDGRDLSVADVPVSWEADREPSTLRVGYTLIAHANREAPTVGGRGLECDKLSREAVVFHWDHFVAKLLQAAQREPGGSVSAVMVDSYVRKRSPWPSKDTATTARASTISPTTCTPTSRQTSSGPASSSGTTGRARSPRPPPTSQAGAS